MKRRTVPVALISVCLIAAAGVSAASGFPAEDPKATLLACLKEITAFIKTDGPTDFFVEGKPDEARFQSRMEKIVQKHFKDLASFEAAAKKYENDPAFKEAEETMLKALMDVVTPPDEQKAPGIPAEAQKTAAPEEKTKLLAFIREMTDYLRSDAAGELFVNGQLDKIRFNRKLEAVALNSFQSMDELDAATRKLQNDPEVETAGQNMVKARQECQKKHGVRPLLPKE